MKKISKGIRVRTPGEKSSGVVTLFVYLFLVGLFIAFGSKVADIIFKWFGWS